MEYDRLLHQLALPEQIIQQMLELKHLALTHEAAARKMTDRLLAEKAYQELDQALGKDPQAMLACQLLAAAKTRHTWQEKGFPDSVFLDTMGCFRRFLGEARVKTGSLVFDRGWWTYRQLSMVIFRIGQLEYELCHDRGAIAVHIPSDAVLTPALVDESLEQARFWIGKLFPDFARSPMTCDSWLLSPELTELLQPGSNILAFQKRFRIQQFHPQAMDCLEWLFRVPENTPISALPEDTSLQRSVKSKLLSGGTIGVALGTMINF